MKMAGAKHGFSVVDIVIFVLSLALSAAVGLWFAFKDRKAQTTSNFLLGGRRMPLLPTTMSMMSSVVSGILLLSYPAEIYMMGTALCWMVVGTVLALVFTGVFIVPVIYRSVKSVSVYQYVEDRFDSKLLRCYSALLFTLSTLMYMSVVLYAPSVALSGVTTIPTWSLILSVGVICTIYTSIGGLKAVVWTDTLQAIIMYAGLLTIVIKSSKAIGGFDKVWEIVHNRSRLDGLFNTDPNPFQYMTVWTAIFGGFFYWLGGFGASQMTLQRYCSMPSKTQARLVPFCTIPFMVVISLLAFYLGLAMFAFYRDCDPLTSGRVSTRDQLVIYFMIEILNSLPGLPGLFLSCLFSGTLSSVSSGINSLSAIGLEEFLRPFYPNIHKNEKQATVITKFLGVVYGVCSIALAFVCGPLGGIFKAVTAGMGALQGPLTGLIILGLFCPWVNWLGAMSGMGVGSAMALWIFIGAQTHKPDISPLSLSTTSCFDSSNTTTSLPFTTEMTIMPSTGAGTGPDEPPLIFYSLSIFMYAIVGCIPTVIVGSLVSLLFCRRKQSDGKGKGLTFWDKDEEKAAETKLEAFATTEITHF